MLSPRKVKFRRPQKGNMRGMSNSGDYVSFGSYGLKAMEAGWITSRQIEAARIDREKESDKKQGSVFHADVPFYCFFSDVYRIPNII